MENTATEQAAQAKDADLIRLNRLAKLLDSQFVIPIINVRFGIDSIIGLIPYIGDMVGMVISFYLLYIMFRKGAGPILILRMLGNVLLDSLIGIIPFLGDIFDIGFKSNSRNIRLMERYYSEDKKRPHAGCSLLFLVILFLVIIVLILWLLLRFIFSLF